MKIAVVGAGGFVGRCLVVRLGADGHEVAPIVRTARAMPGERLIGDIDGATDWSGALAGVEAVVHLAARVHVMDEAPAPALARYRRVNTAGTLNLARAAAAAGVRRFVFLSSIKVNGERTVAGRPFRPDDPPRPEDSYAVSKLEAEQGLLALARETAMEIVIVRPPLVYGPGVAGNFATMMDWLRRGRPLPLGRVAGNRRSLIGIDNLVDFIALCVAHPAAANRVLLVADGEDVSTRALLERLAAAMNRRARLLPVPEAVLRGLARLAGKGAAGDRLLGSLQVDIGESRRLLGWSPPVTLAEGLRRAAGEE